MAESRGLAQRVQTSAAAQAAGTALGKPDTTPTNAMQLFGYGRFRVEMMRMLNDEEMTRRFLQIGLTEVGRVRDLAQCSWQSVAGALLQCATVRLEPGPALSHCWILPFKGSATFVLGYPGVIQLAWRSGLIQDVNASSVCEGDEFLYDEGAAVVVHKRPTRGRRGPAYAYYSIVRYANGGRHIEFMTKEEVQDHAQRHSKSYQSGSPDSPWRTDFDTMAEKTCVLQGKRYMPASIEWNAAVSGDERAAIWTPGSGLRPEDIVTPALAENGAATSAAAERRPEEPQIAATPQDEELAAQVEAGLFGPDLPAGQA